MNCHRYYLAQLGLARAFLNGPILNGPIIRVGKEMGWIEKWVKKCAVRSGSAC